jgi:hypothetical protein
MAALGRVVNMAYWLGLIVWIAAIITVAIAAMNTFATLPDADLGVRLESFAAYPAEHHGRLAAGMVMERNFFAADVMQMVAIPVVVIALLAQVAFLGMSLRRPANLIRCICLLGAAGVFAFYAFTMAPRMNGELRAYWDAARAGDMAQAESHRDAFDADHPRAELVLKINLILAVIGAGASTAAFTGARGGRAQTELEEPMLSRRP